MGRSPERLYARPALGVACQASPNADELWKFTDTNDGTADKKELFAGLLPGRRQRDAGYFQFPVAYGNITNSDQFEPDLNITWGAPVLIADMQGGRVIETRRSALGARRSALGIEPRNPHLRSCC